MAQDVSVENRALAKRLRMPVARLIELQDLAAKIGTTPEHLLAVSGQLRVGKAKRFGDILELWRAEGDGTAEKLALYMQLIKVANTEQLTALVASQISHCSPVALGILELLHRLDPDFAVESTSPVD